MRLHFVAVPVHDSAAAEGALNAFLGSHKVVAVERELVADGPRSVWAVCVTWVEGAPAAEVPSGPSSKKARVDYREVLPPEQFAVYVRLRAPHHPPRRRARLASCRAAVAPAGGCMRRSGCRGETGVGRTGSHRVIRGGSWNSHARNLRAAYRHGNQPGERDVAEPSPVARWRHA